MGAILAILIFLGQLLPGNELFDKGQYAGAAAAFQKIPQAERTASSLNRLAVSYHFLNRLKEAEIAYKEAIKLDPKYADAYNNLGALFYSRKSFGEAERQFRLALESDAEHSAARKNLRSARYARENGRKARDGALDAEKTKQLLLDERMNDSLTVVNLMPAAEIEEASLHERRADSFMARKMFEDAIIEYRKAVALDKYNASTVNRLGLAYHQSQKIKDAELNYREALKLNPYYIEALNNLGTIEFVKKNYDRALDQYKKAIRLRPESSTILHNVGACLFAMQRYDEGLEVYKRALRIDPNLFDHISGFGTIIQTTARNDSMQNFYLAKVFAGAGDKDRAISLLYKAYESGFKDTEKIKAEPAFGGLLEDERFLKLIQTMAADKSVPGARDSRVEYLRFAVELARAAGDVLKHYANREKFVELKGRANLVTAADKESEALIIEAIQKRYPEHAILAEESGALSGSNPAAGRWVIDPLDGTTNFAHQYPFYAVSIGFEQNGKMVCGAVYDPLRDEMSQRGSGVGAFLNGERIQVSDTARLSDALLLTGFPYNLREHLDEIVATFRAFLYESQAVRRGGSAALDLCYLAIGRCDGFWEINLHPWDTAAGKVILEEAGGMLSDFKGGPFSIYLKEVVASNAKFHGEMIRVLGK